MIGWSKTTWRRSRREAAGGGGVGDVAGRDRAVERAAVGGGANHHEGLAVELLRDRLGLLLQLEVAHLELGAVGLEALHVGFGGAQRLALRQEEVAGVAVLDGDDLAHLAELGDALEEYDLHDVLLT